MAFKKIINFDKSYLDNLLNDEHSCVEMQHHVQHLVFLPFHLNDIKESVKDVLNLSVGKFDKKFDALLLSFRDVKLLEPSAALFNDSCFIHFNVEADFYLFKPKVDTTLIGIVNKFSSNHVGCLVHKFFNVSILQPENEEEEWIGSKVEIGQSVLLKVTYVDLNARLPYIRAIFISVLSSSEKDSGVSTGDEGVSSTNTEQRKIKRKRTVSLLEEEISTSKKSKTNLVKEFDDAIQDEQDIERIESNKKSKTSRLEKVRDSELSGNLSLRSDDEKTKRKVKHKKLSGSYDDTKSHVNETNNMDCSIFSIPDRPVKKKKKHRKSDTEIDVTDCSESSKSMKKSKRHERKEESNVLDKPTKKRYESEDKDVSLIEESGDETTKKKKKKKRDKSKDAIESDRSFIDIPVEERKKKKRKDRKSLQSIEDLKNSMLNTLLSSGKKSKHSEDIEAEKHSDLFAKSDRKSSSRDVALNSMSSLETKKQNKKDKKADRFLSGNTLNKIEDELVSFDLQSKSKNKFNTHEIESETVLRTPVVERSKEKKKNRMSLACIEELKSSMLNNILTKTSSKGHKRDVGHTSLISVPSNEMVKRKKKDRKSLKSVDDLKSSIWKHFLTDSGNKSKTDINDHDDPITFDDAEKKKKKNKKSKISIDDLTETVLSGFKKNSAVEHADFVSSSFNELLRNRHKSNIDKNIENSGPDFILPPDPEMEEIFKKPLKFSEEPDDFVENVAESKAKKRKLSFSDDDVFEIPKKKPKNYS